MKIILNKAELAVLVDYGQRRNLTGGFQILTKTLYTRVAPASGELELNEVLAERIVRYMTEYKQGGFQDSFLQPVFRRHLPAILKFISELKRQRPEQDEFFPQNRPNK
jgi:hypothetical protein